MKSSDDLYFTIGRFVLTFGSLETTLMNTLTFFMKHYFPNDNPEYYKTITMILKQNNDFSANLNILRFMVFHLIQERNRLEWELLIKDLDYLMTRRNLYVHNMYGFDENENFVKRKLSSSYKKFPEFITIQDARLKEDCDLLEERYRQLFDSVIEQFVSLKEGLEDVSWICKFPQLMY